MDELIKAFYLRKFLFSAVKIFIYRNRDINFRKLFHVNLKYSIVYCKDVEGLLIGLHFYLNVNLDSWLFIDGSVNSIKAVLIHKKMNVKPVSYTHLTLPTIYSV